MYWHELPNLLLKAFLVALLILFARVALWLLNLLVVAPLLDPLRNLPGPQASFFTNHFSEVLDPSNTPDTYKEWTRLYGKTVRFHGLGKHDYRLMSFDFRVISHVLNSPSYEKPARTRYLLGILLGRGVFTTEGAEHKLQRKIIAPAFTTQAVKGLTPIFFDKARELRDLWDDQITAALSDEASKSPIVTIDVDLWISRATFDAFGLAGFDYNFGALRDGKDEFYTAFRRMFGVASSKSLLSLVFPILDTIWPDEQVKITRESLAIIHKTRNALLADKKAAILAEKSRGSDIEDKDLMSLLLKSNLANDSSVRLSDSDLLDQFSAFLFAGSDSTAIAITWCLHFLTKHCDIQARLREEILSVSNPDDFDAYESLPLLDAVIRETLRMCPPIHGTLREAVQDDYIPISEPIPLRNGEIIQKGECFRIRKGSYVHIPIEGLNLLEDIWGPDALEFNPDRWLSPLPPFAQPPKFPGVANIMTFTLGGHLCPGWKFSICEMKAFIATLLPCFSFRMLDGQDIGKFNSVLMRPFDRSVRKEGLKLPMLVERCGDSQ